MRFFRELTLLAWVVCSLIGSGALLVQGSPSPVTLAQIQKALTLIQQNRERSDPAAGVHRLAEAVRQRGVDFKAEASLIESLRLGGATDELLAAIQAGFVAAPKLLPPTAPLDLARAAVERRDWAAAQAAYLEALRAPSTVLAFNVLVAPWGDNFAEACPAELKLSRAAGVSIESTRCAWKLELSPKGVVAVLPNRVVGASLLAFRIVGRLGSGGSIPVLSLAPQAPDPDQRAMLMNLVASFRE